MKTKIDITKLIEIVQSADNAVMKIYNSNTTAVTNKVDSSPLTNADIASHDILVAGIKNIHPDISIISEEEYSNSDKIIKNKKPYWLIDPIDGTKDFINKTGEFTICVALMEDNIPAFGIVGAPALGELYYGGKGLGFFKVINNGIPQKIIPKKSTKVTRVFAGGINQSTQEFIDKHYFNAKVERLGSQLKFIAVAEGEGAYPRLKTTMKTWDIASGQALVEGAGGSVTRPDGSQIDYTSTSLLAGDFIALPA